jgi:hypothetical protein
MTTVDQTQTLALDTKLLSKFIYALNIARRQVMSYPPGHPMVATATAKLIDVVPRLIEFRKEITPGIARDSLMIEDGLLDAGNPVFQDLARNLFDVLIASLTVSVTRQCYMTSVSCFCRMRFSIKRGGWLRRSGNC